MTIGRPLKNLGEGEGEGLEQKWTTLSEKPERKKLPSAKQCYNTVDFVNGSGNPFHVPMEKLLLKKQNIIQYIVNEQSTRQVKQKKTTTTLPGKEH